MGCPMVLEESFMTMAQYMKDAFMTEWQTAHLPYLSKVMEAFTEETLRTIKLTAMGNSQHSKYSTKGNGKTIYLMEKQSRSIAMFLSTKVTLLTELKKVMVHTNGAQPNFTRDHFI